MPQSYQGERVRGGVRALREFGAWHPCVTYEKFKKLQINLATERLKKIKDLELIGGKPISEFITSSLGIALMLDHHVHRPNLVANTVKTATINTTTKMSKKWETGMLSRLNEDNKDFFINCFDPIAHEIKVLSMKDKARLQALLDNPIHWGNYESKKFVDEYKVARGIDSISGIKKERNDQRLAVFQRNDLDLSSDWNSGTYQ